MSDRENLTDIQSNMAGLENAQITNKSYIATNSYRTSMSLIKNLQQIAMAIYMVTDCVEDTEPLRVEARDAVLKAMKAVSKVMGGVQVHTAEFRAANAAMQLVREHISILEVMGYVSNMNASILLAEIEKFISRLDTSLLDMDSPHEARIPLRSDMSFGIDLGELFYKNNGSVPGSDTSNLDQNNLESSESRGSEKSLGRIEREMGRLKRKSLIMKLFRELPSPAGEKELTLGELVEKYGRYGGEGPISEKTIQRELSELTNDGTLEKIGSKRWVKYRLIRSS